MNENEDSRCAGVVGIHKFFSHPGDLEAVFGTQQLIQACLDVDDIADADHAEGRGDDPVLVDDAATAYMAHVGNLERYLVRKLAPRGYPSTDYATLQGTEIRCIFFLAWMRRRDNVI